MELDSREPFQTRLQPGETFEAPTVFVGCYQGDVDDGANQLHRWVEAHLRPPVHDERYPLLVNNSWGSGMAVDEALAKKMIDDSAELGLELFHIDAGWFRAVGDWRTDERNFRMIRHRCRCCAQEEVEIRSLGGMDSRRACRRAH